MFFDGVEWVFGGVFEYGKYGYVFEVGNFIIVLFFGGDYVVVKG